MILDIRAEKAELVAEFESMGVPVEMLRGIQVEVVGTIHRLHLGQLEIIWLRRAR